MKQCALSNRILYGSLLVLAGTLAAAAPKACGGGLAPRLRSSNLQGGFVVAGVGLRGHGGAGSITIAGVPGLSAVKCALLYWDVLGGNQPPASGNVVTFAGVTVTGALIGSDVSPNQPQPANYSYMAEVTGYVAVAGNGTYSLSGLPTSGDPNGIPETEGASLLLIYGKRGATNQDLLVYDGNATLSAPGMLATTLFDGFDATSSVTAASVAFVVGDGQPDLVDSAYLNGHFLGSNLFGGYDPPGGSFWDSVTLPDVTSSITPSSASAVASVSDDGDGLVWVASALGVDTPYPAADIHLQPQTLLVPRGQDFLARISVQSHSAETVLFTAHVEVQDDRGHFIGYFVTPVNGRVEPGELQNRMLRRTIPTSGIPGRLIGVPITVLAKLVRRGTVDVVDDDFCRFVIQ